MPPERLGRRTRLPEQSSLVSPHEQARLLNDPAVTLNGPHYSERLPRRENDRSEAEIRQATSSHRVRAILVANAEQAA
jgi:hypothetical protein